MLEAQLEARIAREATWRRRRQDDRTHTLALQGLDRVGRVEYLANHGALSDPTQRQLLREVCERLHPDWLVVEVEAYLDTLPMLTINRQEKAR